MKNNSYEEFLLLQANKDSQIAREMKMRKTVSKSQDSNHRLDNFFLPFVDNSDSKYFIKSYKPKLLSAIDSKLKELDSQHTRSRKVKTPSFTLNKKETNSLRSLQQKNLERIKQEELSQEEEAFNTFKSSVEESKNKIMEKKKKPVFGIRKNKEIQRFLRKKSLDQSETSESLLETLNHKLEKSMDRYFNVLENKKRFALRHSERAQSVNFASRIEERSLNKLIKLVYKTKELEKRKKIFLEQAQNKVCSKKENFEKKVSRVKEAVESNEKNELIKYKQIEKRIKAYESVIGDHRKSIEKEQKLKVEKSKFKEADFLQNFMKNVEREKSKKEALVEKIIREKEKADRVKQEKEIKNIKIREKSIEEMIKREKVLDTIIKIRQSPNLNFLTERPKDPHST